MKILVICGSPWRDDLNTGNTFTNLFFNIKDIEIANLFLKSGKPDNNVAKRYFQITEKTLLANLFNSKMPSGRELTFDNKADCFSKKELIIYDQLRIIRWRLFFWVRELIWKIGNWESPELEAFIDDFKPDVIFAVLQNSNYLNNMILFIKKYTNKPLITYAMDDIYTLKQFSLSPLYWVNRLMRRTKIRKVVAECEYLYVITHLQKKEYEQMLNKECRILFKGNDFEVKPAGKATNFPLKFVYTGNISSGRWKTLSKIGEALHQINKDKVKGQLFITTRSPVSKSMENALDYKGSVFLTRNVSNSKVSELQENADVLLHVEPLKLSEMLKFRLSFSTKLVDYFYRGKCILAVGKKSMASIDYLIKNDAALVVTEQKEIPNQLRKIVNNPSLLTEYADKAWECGKRNHQIKIIQDNLYNDLKELVNKGSN